MRVAEISAARHRSDIVLSALLAAMLTLAVCGGDDGSASVAENDNSTAAGDTGEADEASDACDYVFFFRAGDTARPA